MVSPLAVPLTVIVTVVVVVVFKTNHSLCRVGGVEAKVPPLLVHIRQEVPHLGLLPLVAAAEGVGEVHGDGPFPGSGYHHMHCAEHPLHGPGALPHD